MNCKRFVSVEMMLDTTEKGSLQESFYFFKAFHGFGYAEIINKIKLRGVFTFQKDSYVKGGDFVLCVKVTAKDVAGFYDIK